MTSPMLSGSLAPVVHRDLTALKLGEKGVDIDCLFAAGLLVVLRSANVKPPKQLLTLGERVQGAHGFGAGVWACAPHDTPTGLVEQQAEGVCNTGRCRILFPSFDFGAGLMRGDDSQKQFGSQWSGGELFGGVSGRTGRLNKRAAQPGEGLAP